MENRRTVYSLSSILNPLSSSPRLLTPVRPPPHQIICRGLQVRYNAARGVNMARNRIRVASAPLLTLLGECLRAARMTATLALTCLLLVTLVGAALAQDPSGRPAPGKGKRPPKKAPPKTEPQPTTVTLTLLTDPPSSSVYINGLARGVSNAEGKIVLERVPLGRYSVEVRKDGYRPMLKGFEAGSDSPTLVFKLDIDFDAFSKEFNSLVSAGRLAGPQKPNAVEFINQLTAKYGENPEVVKLRGLLIAKLTEPVKPAIDHSVSNWRSIQREEIAGALDGSVNALSLRKDDKRLQAQTAYLRGVLAVYDWQRPAPVAQGEAGGNLDAARTEFENALSMDDSFAAAHYQLGTVLLKSGAAPQAEAELIKTVQMEPQWPPAYVALGNAYHVQSKYKEAIDAYRKAIELDKSSAAALAGLGLSRFAKGEKDGVKDVERSAQMDPSSALPHLNLGIILSQSKNKKDLQRAQDELQRAIQLNQTSFEIQNRQAEQLLADLRKRKK
jgi:tetratricopeptide repeat protein/PEGA domain-containing protein